MLKKDNHIIESNFLSEGIKCAGTLYLPQKTDAKPGVIILGHGFAAERAFCLPEFAQRFSDAGYAAYIFDYRCFGDSEGEPRNWVSPKRHLADWRAVVKHVQALSEIDPGKLIIWGSSLGGGHVLKIASETPTISAVISQQPHVDGLALVLSKSPSDLVIAVAAGIRDLISSFVFGKPYYSKVAGRLGEFAAEPGVTYWNDANDWFLCH